MDLLSYNSSSKHPQSPIRNCEYKQNDLKILKFLTALQAMYSKQLGPLEVYADNEFGLQEVRAHLTLYFKARCYIPNYGTSLDKFVLTIDQKTIQKTIERVIDRLETNFFCNHPPFLGDETVACHTQLGVLCDLFVVDYNISTGNHAHPHSLRRIRS